TVSGLEGWGLVEWAYRASTLLEPSITSVASPISRASTARLAAGGRQVSRAGVLCGCKMQMASIYDWSAYAAGYRCGWGLMASALSLRGEPLSSDWHSTRVDRVACYGRLRGRSVHWARRNLDTHLRSHRSCLPDVNVPPGCGPATSGIGGWHVQCSGMVAHQ